MPPEARDTLTGEHLQRLMDTVPPEWSEQLLKSIYSRACGVQLWTAGTKRPGASVPGIAPRACVLTDRDTGEVVDGFIYSIPPDPVAQRNILEHNLGRPAVREDRKADLVINLIHRVPGRKDRVTPLPEGVEAPAIEEPEEETDPNVALEREAFAAAGYELAPPEDDPDPEGG